MFSIIEFERYKSPGDIQTLRYFDIVGYLANARGQVLKFTPGGATKRTVIVAPHRSGIFNNQGSYDEYINYNTECEETKCIGNY